MRRPLPTRQALRFSPLVKAGWTGSSCIKCVPFVPACAEPVIYIAGRPAAERAADSRTRWLVGLLFLKLAVWGNGGSISRWTHLLGSLNSLFFGKAASVLPHHPHFLPTETCVLDRHAEEHVFVLLVVGGKGVLVQYDSLNIGGAHPREVRKLLPYGCDQAGLPLHAFVTVHRATRIADSESVRIP